MAKKLREIPLNLSSVSNSFDSITLKQFGLEGFTREFTMHNLLHHLGCLL